MHKHTKKRKAFIFTLFYPYLHQGVSYDPYVASEVETLARGFDTVDVISLCAGHDGQLEIPANVNVTNLHLQLNLIDKLSSVLLPFKAYFREELKGLEAYDRQIDLKLLKAIAIYAVRAEKYKAFLEGLLKKMDFNEYDVVIYSYWNFEYALAAALLKQKYPVKIVTRNHSLDLYFERMPENYQPFKRFVFKQSDLFVIISQQGLKYFIERHRIPPAEQGKIFLNRVGMENHLPIYTHNYEKIVLLSNAWIQPLKRIDLLIKSLALINDIPIEWIHIGDDYGTSRMPGIMALAETYLKDKPNIRYEFAGRKNMEGIFEIYQARKVDLFINLSTTEGIPVSMMEALSFGVPIIGTSVGGVPEIVEDKVNGFLFPVEVSAQHAADGISAFFRLPAMQRDKLSANARRIWDERFNAAKNSNYLLERILSLYS